jgi:hypothetical protein
VVIIDPMSGAAGRRPGRLIPRPKAEGNGPDYFLPWFKIWG